MFPVWHFSGLSHWGWVTRICISKLTVIASDNGLSPGRRQAIIWTSAGILLIRTSGTNFSEILSEICAFSFKKMHLKMASAKWRPFCLGHNVLMLRCCLTSYLGIPMIEIGRSQNSISIGNTLEILQSCTKPLTLSSLAKTTLTHLQPGKSWQHKHSPIANITLGLTAPGKAWVTKQYW